MSAQQIFIIIIYIFGIPCNSIPIIVYIQYSILIYPLTKIQAGLPYVSLRKGLNVASRARIQHIQICDLVSVHLYLTDVSGSAADTNAHKTMPGPYLQLFLGM